MDSWHVGSGHGLTAELSDGRHDLSGARLVTAAALRHPNGGAATYRRAAGDEEGHGASGSVADPPCSAHFPIKVVYAHQQRKICGGSQSLDMLPNEGIGVPSAVNFLGHTSSLSRCSSLSVDHAGG